MIGSRPLRLARKSFAWSLSSRHEQSVYLSLRGAEGDEAIPEIATPRQVGARNDKEESLDTLNESSRQGITFTPSYR
jgi:hypothetical protein